MMTPEEARIFETMRNELDKLKEKMQQIETTKIQAVASKDHVIKTSAKHFQRADETIAQLQTHLKNAREKAYNKLLKLGLTDEQITDFMTVFPPAVG